MNGRNRRLNDRGMTLVELLIAIVILAIIVVPLLHSFVSSARVNMDARKKLKITTTAQDVMEGLRADTLEDLALQIYYHDGVSSNGVVRDGFHIIDKALVKGTMSENRCVINPDGSVDNFTSVSDTAVSDDDKPCIESTNGGETYEFKRKDDGKYYFYMTDVTVENVGTPNYKVDVLISADADYYRDPSIISVNSARHNGTPLVDISDMNSLKDFVFSINEKEMLDNINAANYTSYSLKDTKVTVSITLEKKNIGGNDKIQATVSSKLQALSPLPTTHYDESNQVVTRDTVRNIYLFYSPTYNGDISGVTVPDEINIINNDKLDNNLYIVKQYDDAIASTGFLDQYEMNYRCKITIGESGETNCHTKIRTNLDYNLYKVLNNTGVLERVPVSQTQTEYVYNTDVKDPLTWESNGEKVISPMGGGEITDRIYNASVYVYKEGSIANALSPGGGGTIAADNLLISLDGSMQ